jgi:ATP-binding cassette subfamily B (MDR/TAP) protein 1
VAFATVISTANFTTSDSNFITAANNFKAVTAQDAVKLVYVGIALFVGTYLYMLIWVYTGAY